METGRVNKRNVGILIFDEVEVLDFAGPYEVFSRTRTEPGVASRRTETAAPFRVFTVGKTTSPIRATGGHVSRRLKSWLKPDKPAFSIG